MADHVRIEDAWRTEIMIEEGRISTYIWKTARNEREADRIRRDVKLAGGTCEEISYSSRKLETVENRSDAECYHQIMRIENDTSLVFILLECKV